VTRLIGVFFLTLTGTGCYRTTSVEVAELDRLEPLPDDKLSVRYADGTTETYAADRARVELRSGEQSEFESPLGAHIDHDRLRLVDANGEQHYALRDVEELELEADAPDRPWVIAAFTLGAGLLGGAIGAGTQSCNDEWGCTGPAVAGFGGFLIGVPVGLALSIPLSASLTPERKPGSRWGHTETPQVDP
jgi:hypothetical protein